MPRLVLVFLASGLACSHPEVASPGPPTVGPAGPAVVAPTGPAVAGKPATPTPTFAPDDRAAVVKAWEEATGRKPDEHDCVAWAASFPRVVVVGSFAHDRGCDVDGLFVDRKFHAADGEVAGLATRDFAGATGEQKQALARSWVEEVAQTFTSGFLSEPSAAFEFTRVPKFVAPQVAAGPDGGVVVRGWEREPPGMVDQDAFNYVIYSFTTEGRMSTKSEQSFAVEGAKLRAREASKTGG